ncbi:MAG: hypothetical protein R3293_06150 [Candidatus Promineifilaceae bacterium]|nr:hypothetical protein [Candidatus Promineifilaceae bacterium]
MTPIVDGLEREFAGRANVVQLDAAEAGNEHLQQAFGLRGHPSFVILDADGRVQQTFIGPQTAEILRAALRAVADN